MALLTNVPQSKAGQVALWIGRKDQEIAERFILLVRSSMVEKELNRLNQEIHELGEAGT